MPGRSSVTPAGRWTPLAVAEPAEVPHRPVQHRVGRPAVRAGHRLGEEHRVLVGEQVEVGVEVRLVARTAPGRAGASSRRSVETASAGRGPERAVGDVGHHVQPERRDPGDARVLDAGVVRAALPARVRLEHHALAARRRPGTPSLDHDSASPTRETLPAATSRGSRYSAPSGPRPLAGFSTPSASSGSPGSGVMTTPSRSARTGRRLVGQRARSALHARAEVGRDEMPLEDDEQRDRRGGQHDRRRRGSRRTGWPSRPATLVM